MGIELEPHELREVFGDEDPTQHAAEAQERWGDTDAWAQSHARTSSYGKQDWLRLKAETADLEQRFAAALAAGLPASSHEARALAEEHRRHLDRWFYPCGHEQHRGLAALYVADPRYTAQWDDVAPGFSRYVHDAILANASGGA